MPGFDNSLGQPDIVTYMRMLERRLARLERGVIGAASDDATVIASLAITGLTLATQTVTQSDDYYKVMLRYSWDAVPDDPSEYNKDALQGYLVSWSFDGVHYTPETTTKDTAIDIGPFNQGATVTFRVRAVTAKYTLGPYTTATNSTTTDATAPFQPSTPAVTPYLGQLAIDWNGLDVSSNQPPTDFRFVEVHLSTTSATFTPTVVTLQGTILRGGGTWIATDLNYATTYYARLVAVDTVGNRSPASTAGVGVPEQVVNGDVGVNAIATANIQNLAVNNAKISDLSVGKLTVGTLTANMTVSARIMTAATGSRVEMNSAGIQAFNSSGTQTLDVASATGNVTITGAFKTDFSTSVTPHIEIASFNNTIYFTDNSGTGANAAFMNAPLDAGNAPMVGINTGKFTYGGASAAHRLYMANAGGIYLETRHQTQPWAIGYSLAMTDSSMNLGRLNPTAGTVTGGQFYMDTNSWSLQRLGAGVQNGGQISADTSNLYLSSVATGATNAQISLNDNGTIWIDGRLQKDNPDGNVCIFAGSIVVNAGVGGAIISYGATLATAPKIQCNVARGAGTIGIQATAFSTTSFTMTPDTTAYQHTEFYWAYRTN